VRVSVCELFSASDLACQGETARCWAVCCCVSTAVIEWVIKDLR